MPRLLVTGTRHGRTDVWGYLDAYLATYGAPEQVIVGDATGVDAQVATFFRERNLGASVEVFRADWAKHGNAAGPKCNTEMVGRCSRGDHCIAFPHPDHDKRRGTTGCYTMAMAAGLIGWWL